MTSYYRNLIQVEILSNTPWTDDQLQQLDVIHEAITDGDSSGMVAVQVQNEQLSREDMEHALTVQGSHPSFLIPDYDEDDGPSAELWAVHYEIRPEDDPGPPVAAAPPVAAGLVEVDGPYAADADRHAKAWVSEHDDRFRPGHYVRILRAVPARED